MKSFNNLKNNKMHKIVGDLADSVLLLKYFFI